jgi:FKBP-type peptidyl-prolyl cis-trans isomerase FkpA
MNRQQRLLVMIAGVALVLMVGATVLFASSPTPTARRAVQPSDSAQANLAAGEAFLAENGQRQEVTTSITGLQFEVVDVDETDTRTPEPTDTVVVHYRGTLIDGTQFDSSYDRGQPATFRLNEVIAGWTEGLQLMTVGDTFRFYVPPNLGYGASANPRIPANSVLIFDVELLDIVGRPSATPVENGSATQDPDAEAEADETPETSE